MRVLKWLVVQSAIAIVSWLFSVCWMATLFLFLDVEETIFWIVGAIASGLLPLISFLESLLMILFKRPNRMGFFDSLFTAVALVVGPFLFGYLYFVGECVECEPIIAALCFSVLVFAVPTALAQSSIRKMFVKL
jgi:hypothetical protein